MSRLLGSLMLQDKIGLLPLGWRVIHCLRSLRSTPSALRDVERAGADASIDLASLHINQVRLCVHDCAGLAFVIYTDDLCSKLELLAGRGCR